MPEATTARKTGKTAAQEAATPPLDPAQAVWDRLAAPFAQEDLERLPKPLRARDENKGRCEDTNQGRYYSADGHYCGGWHAKAVHLDYVGHAGITTRLNDVLGPGGWDFRPMALDAAGLPLIQRGEFWARLTVKVLDQEPVTKTDLAANFNSTQEAWGDALRRCAMRFGVGTYLWAKSEAALALKQAADDTPPPEPERRTQEQPPASQAAPEPPAHVQRLQQRLMGLGVDDSTEVRAWWSEQGLPFLADLDEYQAAAVHSYLDERAGNTANPQ